MDRSAQGVVEDGAAGPFSLALALTASAGCVDAVGFLKLGKLFVSFMSGNSTQLIVRGLQGRGGEAAQAAAIIGLFTLGAFAGALVGWSAGERRRRPTLMAVEAALLALAVLIQARFGEGGGTGVAIGLTALAMGLQNSVLHKAGATQVHPFVTSALVKFAEELAHALIGEGAAFGWVRHLSFWAVLMAGAGLGVSFYARFGFAALLGPAALLALLSFRELTQSRPEAIRP